MRIVIGSYLSTFSIEIQTGAGKTGAGRALTKILSVFERSPGWMSNTEGHYNKVRRFD